MKNINNFCFLIFFLVKGSNLMPSYKESIWVMQRNIEELFFQSVNSKNLTFNNYNPIELKKICTKIFLDRADNNNGDQTTSSCKIGLGVKNKSIIELNELNEVMNVETLICECEKDLFGLVHIPNPASYFHLQLIAMDNETKTTWFTVEAYVPEDKK